MMGEIFMSIPVVIMYDAEADVYIAENDEIGLALESGSLDKLIERLRTAVPEMAQANGIECTGLDITTTLHQAVYA